MKINYGLWWDEGKERKSNNFSIEHDMDWDNQQEHDKFRQMIYDKHPGKRIIGYAIDEPKEELT